MAQGTWCNYSAMRAMWSQRTIQSGRSGPSGPTNVRLRLIAPEDARALARLAALDSQAPPDGPTLAAEVRGELWAAVALDTSAVIADPFRPTADLVELLRERRAQLNGMRSRAPGTREPRWRRWLRSDPAHGASR